MNRILIRAEDVPLPAWSKAAAGFAKKVLKALDLDGWEVSALFCSNRYIKSLNAQYRNKDEPTDALSFSAGGGEPGGPFAGTAKGRLKAAGDIVVSLDALEENAVFFNVSRDEELRRLLVHGILHLFGFDHATNDAGEPMLKAQEEMLARLGGEIISAPASPAAERIP